MLIALLVTRNMCLEEFHRIQSLLKNTFNSNGLGTWSKSKVINAEKLILLQGILVAKIFIYLVSLDEPIHL